MCGRPALGVRGLPNLHPLINRPHLRLSMIPRTCIRPGESGSNYGRPSFLVHRAVGNLRGSRLFQFSSGLDCTTRNVANMPKRPWATRRLIRRRQRTNRAFSYLTSLSMGSTFACYICGVTTIIAFNGRGKWPDRNGRCAGSEKAAAELSTYDRCHDEKSGPSNHFR
jgi:hypothetical protein